VEQAARACFNDYPRDELWLISSSLWAQVAAELGMRDACRLLYERLLPWSGQVPSAVIAVVEPVDFCLGELAMVLGRTADAEMHFTGAEATARGLRAPFFIARTLIEQARLSNLRPIPEAAQARLDEALAIARCFGYRLLERRVIEAQDGFPPIR
jgi:hypothetical protein